MPVRLRVSSRVPVSTQVNPAIASIRVVEGDATLLTAHEVCTSSCQVVQISERISELQCTTTCTTQSSVIYNRPLPGGGEEGSTLKVSPPPSSPRYTPVFDPVIVFGDSTYEFNLQVIGTHKISNTYAIGHAEGYVHRNPSVRFYFPGF